MVGIFVTYAVLVTILSLAYNVTRGTFRTFLAKICDTENVT